MKKRTLVLLGILILVVLVSLFRGRKHAAPTNTVNATLAPDSGDTAATWAAYDHAASLRDADVATFQPALTALKSATADVKDPNLVTNARILTDVKSCTTWLLFYRQPGWKARSTKHVDNCVRDHRDEAQ